MKTEMSGIVRWVILGGNWGQAKKISLKLAFLNGSMRVTTFKMKITRCI